MLFRIILALALPLARQQPETAGKVAPAASEPVVPTVWAQPNPALPGQTVRFYWPGGWGGATLTGGGFGAKKAVRGANTASDRPMKTTLYTVSPPAAGKKDKKDMNPPEKQVIPVHVYEGQFPRLATYGDTRNWVVDVLAGWNRYVVDLPDPANNALMFFEPQEDSVERTAVSVVPADGMDAEQLMRKVETEIPTQYDRLTVLEKKRTTHCGLPAAWMTFTGTEVSHPDTPSKSMVLAFVKGPRGYVISARTSANRFAQQEKLLRCLVRSFAFEVVPPKPKPTPKSAAPKRT